MARLIRIERGAGVRILSDRLRELAPALDGIGAYLTSKTQAAFREQKRGKATWAPRMTPNVPGIVSDLNRGVRPPGRRFVDSPALRDTGRLLQSITWKVRRRREVVVGSSLPYAQIHQRGGVQQITLAKQARGGLVELLRDRPELRTELGWLFQRPTFMVRVQARPFLMVTQEDMSVLREIVRDYLTGGSP